MINISTKALEALLSDTRYIKYKVIAHFDKETDITEDVISVDTLDEASSSNADNPFGVVSYNEATINLDNIEGKYFIGNASSPYANYLVSGIRIDLYYYIEVGEDVFEEIPGGTYYTNEWSCNTSSLTTLLTCYDRLSIDGLKPVMYSKVHTKMRIKNAFRYLFEACDIASDDYVIDESLNDTLSMFWIDGTTLSEGLTNLAVSTGVNVFVNKDNKIVVKSILNNVKNDLTISDDDIIISSSGAPSYNNIYDKVTMHYLAYMADNNEDVYSVDNITLNPGVNKLTSLKFNKCPVSNISSIIIEGAKNITVQNFNSSDKELELVLNNGNNKAVECSIKVAGAVITTSEQSIVITNTPSPVNALELTLNNIHSKEYVSSYGNKVLNTYKGTVANLDIPIRGLPILEVGDRLKIVSPTSRVDNDFIINSISHTYENGLKGTLKVLASTSKVGEIMFIGPGMYTVRRD